MQFICGMAFGCLMAAFCILFGMALQRSIDSKDGDDEE